VTGTGSPRKRIVVIGGGLAGLAATYDLSRAGHHVTILESAPDLGGLASSFALEGHPIERFYHFICRSDRTLCSLVDELGLGDKLRWHQTRTAFYHDGQHYSFGTPVDLLKFTAVPLVQRFRFGIHVFRSRYRSEWRRLDGISAKQWLIDNIGQQAYEVIWHPLLKVKFGDYHDQISAAWIWHRIWRVATSRSSILGRESFGYLEHGTATLVDRLAGWMRTQRNIDLRLGVRVSPLAVTDGRVTEVRVGEETIPCDAVISTVALPSLARLVPGQTDQYFATVAGVEYIGVVCMLLSLKRSFSPNFWTNINDPRISFNGIIEQTNLNHNLRAAGLNVIYIPFYLPTTEPRYSASPEALFAEYIPMLKIVNPAFNESWIKEWHVFRAPYAQAIFATHFVARMPDHRSSVRGLFVTDSTQFYPEDRTISAAIAQGRTVARLIDTDEASG
jgi:protoporphyrinogen oxidase